MSSERRIAANKRNAQNSRGPRTAAAKARVSRNAFSHGLAASAFPDKSFSAQVEKLARALAHPNGDAASLAQARIIVEAEQDLQRIGAAKVSLLNADIGAVSRSETTVRFGPDDVRGGAAGPDDVATALINALPQLIRFGRYERRARSRQARAMRLLIVRKALPQM
jgi:hypothetical protein